MSDDERIQALKAQLAWAEDRLRERCHELEAEVARLTLMVAEERHRSDRALETRNLAQTYATEKGAEVARLEGVVVSQSQLLGNTRSQREHELAECLADAEAEVARLKSDRCHYLNEVARLEWIATHDVARDLDAQLVVFDRDKDKVDALAARYEAEHGKPPEPPLVKA